MLQIRASVAFTIYPWKAICDRAIDSPRLGDVRMAVTAITRLHRYRLRSAINIGVVDVVTDLA
jgi:hypothetical protein